MQSTVHSEPGYGHRNEDVVEVRAHPQAAEMLLCALADGQGGRSGGAEAARIAVEKSLATATAYAPDALWQGRTWKAIVRTADEAAMQSASAGYTTLICLCSDGKRLYGASCGDSAALLLNDGAGQVLTEHQYKDPPVGSGVADPVAFSAVLGSTWKVVMMSDGVWKYVGWGRLLKLARQYEGDELIRELRQVAAAGWGGKLPDDFSLALLLSS